MTKCQRCNSTRIVSVSAHCDDRCVVSIGNVAKDGYVPYGMNIGGGDDVEFDLCLDCGQQQGKWPCTVSDFERKLSGAASPAKQKFVKTQDTLLATHPDIVESVIAVAGLPDVTVYEITTHLFDNGNDDVERIAAAIIALYRNPAHAIMGEAVLDKFYGWENYYQLEEFVEYDTHSSLLEVLTVEKSI
mgnify:CR=1 FL=1